MAKVSTKFFQKPRNCEATSASDVAVGVPCEKPVPTGLTKYWISSMSRGVMCQRTYCSTQTMFVRLVQLHGLGVGLRTPYCQRTGPFSWNSPSREEHPGPPF